MKEEQRTVHFELELCRNDCDTFFEDVLTQGMSSAMYSCRCCCFLLIALTIWRRLETCKAGCFDSKLVLKSVSCRRLGWRVGLVRLRCVGDG